MMAVVLLGVAFSSVAGAAGPIGVDCNYLLQMQSAGKTWSDASGPVDPLAVFAKAGCGVARIRLWVGDDGVNQLKYATETAKRAQAAGLKPQLVLFLSEEWADFVKQPAPKAWVSLDDAGRAAAVEKYAAEVTRHFADAGVAIDTFEIGNEIDFGVCGVFEEAWPHRVSIDYMRATIWPRMMTILKAAEAGVRSVKPDAKLVLHLSQWNNADYCVAFWRSMIDAGVQVDVAGLSYFPTSVEDRSQQPLAYLQSQAARIDAAIGKPVMICESGYPSTPSFGGQFAAWNHAVDGYPLNPVGQAKWIGDFASIVRRDPHFAGAIYWSPEWYGGGLWDAFALFDEHGVARPATGSFGRAATDTPVRGTGGPPVSSQAATALSVNEDHGRAAHATDGGGATSLAVTTTTATMPSTAVTPTTLPASQPTHSTSLTIHPTSAPAIATGLHVYFGNLHSHTADSDGTGTPTEAYAYARDVAKIDFLAVTDHNHLLGGEHATPEQRSALYVGPGAEAIIPAANAANQDGKFVAIYGQEAFTMSSGNHVNVFDVPAVIDVPNGQYAQLLPWLAAHPDSTGQTPIVQFNHPMLNWPQNTIGKKEYGRDDFAGDADWVKQMGSVTPLIEMLNGEPLPKGPAHRTPQVMETYYRLFLAKGFHLAPTGNQDNHHKQWGDITDSRTGILAANLTRKDLLGAMRARHVYASEDKNLRLIFTVDGHLAGDEITAPGPLQVAFHLDDADEPSATYTIDAMRGRIDGPPAREVGSASLTGNLADGAFDAIDGLSLQTPGEFVYFRITQTSEQGTDVAWTAPVWLTLPAKQ